MASGKGSGPQEYPIGASSYTCPLCEGTFAEVLLSFTDFLPLCLCRTCLLLTETPIIFENSQGRSYMWSHKLPCISCSGLIGVCFPRSPLRGDLYDYCWQYPCPSGDDKFSGILPVILITGAHITQGKEDPIWDQHHAVVLFLQAFFLGSFAKNNFFSPQ